MTRQGKLIILILSFYVCSCSTASMYTSTNGESISMSISGLSPSRNGESYALWLEFPKASPGGKQNQVQHANFVKILVSGFRIGSDGKLEQPLDTAHLAAKLGYPLSLAAYALISVEKSDSIGSTPTAAYLAGDITGDASLGKATLTSNHLDGLNYGFTDMAAVATLAYPPGKPSAGLELYLMNATGPTQTSVGISSLPLLPEPWQYSLWVVDSATKSLPPFNIFYGTFASPAAFQNGPADSQPNDNHYPYPGGRYPADTSQTVYDLRSDGKVSVMLTLEPFAASGRPFIPFGAIVLQATISPSTQAFSPFTLSNIAGSSFPTAQITIQR